ncbi:hypothetical protein DXG01_004459 [Tephrocybe rancida]|nr:hypothetical protein DXG01_004459 [Tephrocybe rancida]
MTFFTPPASTDGEFTAVCSLLFRDKAAYLIVAVVSTWNPLGKFIVGIIRNKKIYKNRCQLAALISGVLPQQAALGVSKVRHSPCAPQGYLMYTLPSSEKVIDSLVLFSINVGILTSVIATCVFITYLVIPNFTFAGIHAVGVKGPLNSRVKAREMLSADQGIPLMDLRALQGQDPHPSTQWSSVI